MSFVYVMSLFFFLILCGLVCLVILVQEGKGGGLGASFGGDSSDSMFGASTPEVLKKVTAYLAIIFVTSCILLSFWTGSLGRRHLQKADTEMVTTPRK